jgi:hypothetical protein
MRGSLVRGKDMREGREDVGKRSQGVVDLLLEAGDGVERVEGRGRETTTAVVQLAGEAREARELEERSRRSI